VFLHSHAGKKSELVERAVFTLVAPSLCTVGSPPPARCQIRAIDRIVVRR